MPFRQILMSAATQGGGTGSFFGSFVANGYVFDGDSIYAGTGTYTLPWPAQFLTNTGKSGTNIAVAGRTFAFINTNYATLAGASYNAGTRNVLLCNAGINDIINAGATAADVQATAIAYSAKALASGYFRIAQPLLPTQVAGITGAQQTHITNYNTWLRANWNVYFDALYDVAALAGMTDSTNTQYYLTDKLHPSNYGGRVMAEGLRLALGLPLISYTGFNTTPLVGSWTFGTGSKSAVQTSADNGQVISASALSGNKLVAIAVDSIGTITNFGAIGIASGAASTAGPGFDTHSLATLIGSNSIWANGFVDGGLSGIVAGSLVGMAINTTSKKIWFTLDFVTFIGTGSSSNNAAAVAAGTNGFSFSTPVPGSVFVAVGAQNTGAGNKAFTIFPWPGALPSGFTQG